MSLQSGFTLLEVMVVLAITATLCAGVVMALPSSHERVLNREAERLAAWLEVARAHSRSRGALMVAKVSDGHARLQSAQGESTAELTWESTGVHALPVRIVLGPEPVIAAQQVVMTASGVPAVQVATQGVRPFRVERAP